MMFTGRPAATHEKVIGSPSGRRVLLEQTALQRMRRLRNLEAAAESQGEANLPAARGRIIPMVHEMNDGTFRQTNLTNESADYLTKREELRLAEIELMRQRERVAELRRQLPQGAPVEDYPFEEGPANLDAGDTPIRTVRMSELFTAPDRPLVVYHFMYGKRQTKACPMCTAWIDGFNGVAHHLAQNIDFIIAAAADPSVLRSHGRARGWNRLRLLSCGRNTFKFDLGSEDHEGNQDSTVSVFTRGNDGVLRHFYTAHPRMAADISERGIDLLSPIWNVLDLTPKGRGDFYTKLDYPPGSHA